MKYRITYYRPYLPHPERDEPQRGIVIAGSVDEVLDIYSDCHVTHVEELPEVGATPKGEQIMTPVGINNGNFRNGDYQEWAAQDLSGVPTWDELMEMKKVKETYGENWEQDADALRACVDSVNLHPVEAAYQLEQAMDDPRTEWERDWDEHCAETLATRKEDWDVTPILPMPDINFDKIEEIPF